MEVEYSTEVRGKVHAFRFEAWERVLISNALQPYVKKLVKQIERIRNDPRNEGQATYQSDIDELEREKRAVQQIIDTLYC